jgi:hypothetical protein
VHRAQSLFNELKRKRAVTFESIDDYASSAGDGRGSSSVDGHELLMHPSAGLG